MRCFTFSSKWFFVLSWIKNNFMINSRAQTPEDKSNMSLVCHFDCVWGVTKHGTMGHHWFSQGLVVCLHKAFAWTKVNSLWPVYMAGAMSFSVNVSLLLLAFFILSFYFFLYFKLLRPIHCLMLTVALSVPCCAFSRLTLPTSLLSFQIAIRVVNRKDVVNRMGFVYHMALVT